MALQQAWKLTASGGMYGWYANPEKYKGSIGTALGITELKDKEVVNMRAPIPAPKLRLNGYNGTESYSTMVYCAPGKLESAMKALVGDSFTAKNKKWKIRSVSVVKK